MDHKSIQKKTIRSFEAKGKKICQNANFALKELQKSVDFATVDIELEKRKINIQVCDK